MTAANMGQKAESKPGPAMARITRPGLSIFGQCGVESRRPHRQRTASQQQRSGMYSALDIDLKPGQGFGIFEIGGLLIYTSMHRN